MKFKCAGNVQKWGPKTWPAHCIFQQSINSSVLHSQTFATKTARKWSTSWVQHNSQIFRKLSWSPHLHNLMNKGKELHANIYWLEPSPKKQGRLQRWLKRQISSYCRHILTFPAHLNLISRSTSSIVLEPNSGASSLKKQGNLHRCLNNVSFCRHIWTFSAHWNFVSRSTSSMVPVLSSWASSLKKNRDIFTVG